MLQVSDKAPQIIIGEMPDGRPGHGNGKVVRRSREIALSRRLPGDKSIRGPAGVQPMLEGIVDLTICECPNAGGVRCEVGSISRKGADLKDARPVRPDCAAVSRHPGGGTGAIHTLGMTVYAAISRHHCPSAQHLCLRGFCHRQSAAGIGRTAGAARPAASGDGGEA